MSDFQDYCCSNLENENTSTIEMWTYFTEAATERCSSDLCLATIIKIILKCLWRNQIFKLVQINTFWVNFQINSNEHLFRYISRIFIAAVKQLCYVAFFYKKPLDKMRLFVALVYSLQPSITVTRNSILGAAGVLESPLELYKGVLKFVQVFKLSKNAGLLY